MRTWTTDELARLGETDELDITTMRADGRARRSTPIWVVRVGDDLIVRSYRGRDGAWFRHAVADGRALVRAGHLERDVSVEELGDDSQEAVDHAYRTKYGRHGGGYVDAMLRPQAVATTLRLIPT